MSTQARQPVALNRDLREDCGENPYMEDDPFIPMPIAPRRSTATAMPTSAMEVGSVRDDSVHSETVQKEAVQNDVMQKDAMQDSPLIASGHAPELDGQEELGLQLAWVSLDIPRGLLVCKSLNIEVNEFVGTIVESRVVRVMGNEDEKYNDQKDIDEKDKDGGVFCASSNRQTADVGRPGRECSPCEDRRGCCFPRWWIAWREEESGQMFAHTLSQIGTMNFTRYAAKLKRDGRVPSEVVTRIFVEEARRQKAGTVYRRLQFEQDDPFRDQ